MKKKRSHSVLKQNTNERGWFLLFFCSYILSIRHSPCHAQESSPTKDSCFFFHFHVRHFEKERYPTPWQESIQKQMLKIDLRHRLCIFSFWSQVSTSSNLFLTQQLTNKEMLAQIVWAKEYRRLMNCMEEKSILVIIINYLFYIYIITFMGFTFFNFSSFFFFFCSFLSRSTGAITFYFPLFLSLCARSRLGIMKWWPGLNNNKIERWEVLTA